jgi:bile acid-coenzyme A ligase
VATECAGEQPHGLVSMGTAIRRAAEEDPDRLIVRAGESDVTWSRLFGFSSSLAARLDGAGVRVGDLVGVLLPNGVPFFVAIAAAWGLGATPLLLSPRMVQHELSELLALAAPRAVVTSMDIEYSAPVVRPDAADREAGSAIGPVFGEMTSPRWIGFHSGGSTGRPKIIVAEQQGYVGPGSDIDHLTRGYRMSRDTVLLLPGPLCHAGPFGLATYTFFARGQLVVMDRFDPEDVLRLTEHRRVTTLFVVPTMMNRIMQLDPAIRSSYDLSSLRTVWHAAAPCPPWLKRAWIEWLGPERIHESYGASDAASMTRIDGLEWMARPGSVGRPAFGDVAIFGPDGSPLPPGQVGDIYMKPPAGAMRREYIGGAAPVSVGDWSTVGDMGWLDEDGYLYLADRRTDLIITGGMNVYPAEVEGAIDAHPLVISSAVVGIRDDDLGKRIHAVVYAPGFDDSAELIAFVRGRLSPYKVPKTVEFVDEPVRDDAGKVRRVALAEKAGQQAQERPSAAPGG